MAVSARVPSPLVAAPHDLLDFRSAPFLRAVARLDRLARNPHVPILIEGESGTGKTQLARRVHALSPRSRGPLFHAVLSTLDDNLASSELFGHVAGAFTGAAHSRPGYFASANGGSLVLDEIAKASSAVQQKLLHAIEYGEVRPVGSDRVVHVDVRIIAATNRSLGELAEAGDFLPDLYARIEVFRVCLPPLRQRRPDIPVLVCHYVRRHACSCGYETPPDVDDALMQTLQDAPWPNNLRQLDATIQCLLIDANGAPVLSLENCQDHLTYLRDGPVKRPLTAARVSEALERGGSISAAARLLGVDRTTLHRYRRRSGGA